MRIAVVGMGAVGGLYGARLQAAGHDVHFLVRSGLDHIRSHGLRVDSPDGAIELERVQVSDDPGQLPACELVVVATKSTTNDILPAVLPKLTAADGAVLMLQNGLDVEHDAAVVVPTARIYGGLCFVCSHKQGPGHIHHLDYGYVTLGAHDARALAQQDAIVAVLRDTGFDILAVDDVAAARWRKLAWNIPFSGLCTVLDVDTRVVMDQHRQRAEDLLHEVAAIAAASGKPLPDGHVEKMLHDTDAMVPYLPSLTLDRRHGRDMEIDTIFSRPLRAAERLGIAAPALQQLHAELSALPR